MKNKTTRLLILTAFLLSLLCGAVSVGGLWFSSETFNRMGSGWWSVSRIEACESLMKQEEVQEEASDIANCVEGMVHTDLAFGFLGIIVSAISGILALVFLIIGIISQRRYRRRLRLEQQGQLNGG